MKDSVLFTDIRSDVPQLLSACDLLLLPSLFGGMPNVVIEAQVVGLSCTVSDSITMEAKTGLVTYLDNINVEPILWADYILSKSSYTVMDTRSVLVKKGCDIDSLSKVFITTLLDDRSFS